MEIFANEIQQNVKYWGNLRQISIINIVCLQSDYIKVLFLVCTLSYLLQLYSS